MDNMEGSQGANLSSLGQYVMTEKRTITNKNGQIKQL